ncbi:WD40 repeat-like protein, partial [Suillus decipiens]
TVRLWEVATGKPVGKPLLGHTRPVTSVSFSPDGTRIATGSWDGTVRLWNVAMGKPVCEIGEPTDGVHSVSFSPDGTRVASGLSNMTSMFALPGEDGWIRGPNRRLLFWVPPASRNAFYNPQTALVIPRRGPELDLSRMAHGTRW